MPGHVLIRDNATGELVTSDGVRVYDVPDPSGEPDGRWLRTSGGAAVWDADSGGVTSIDGITGDITLVSGSNVTITPNSPTAGDITIAATGSGGGALPGNSSLVYRYTVTGSDKASIDTGSDSPDAGSNDWTNGDLLEIFLYTRTDEAAILSAINITLNNDGGSVYDKVQVQTSNTTVSGANTRGAAFWAENSAGASAASGVFASHKLTFPNFAGTVGNKSGSLEGGVPDNSTSIVIVNQALDYRPASPAAIDRFAVAPATAGKKLKVGSQLLIYKRLAA